MNWEAWKEKYKPLQNHITPSLGIMFETYGEEVDYLRTVSENNIWTLRDGDEGNLIITAGYGWVNRLGYYVTAEPWEEADKWLTVEA